MIDADLLTFVVVAGILTLSPGADTMLVLRNALSGGSRSGVVTTFGICSGLFVHACLSALGLSVILLHSAGLYTAVKIAGAAYLVWLGLQSLRKAARGEPGIAVGGDGTKGNGSPRKWFLEGFLSNVLNPKAVVFYLAFLPQFIKPGDPVLLKSLMLASIHYVMGVTYLVSLSFVVDRARRFVVRSSVRRWLDGLCGGALVGLGVMLALERR